ncbi:hypothetical protein PIROE2DRAFT_61076 [Piromyces sp. E2]|nr:hypothetical protein PIROE2DRAFT_61076 [Piromyces sp. E2]|eukprot:OUM63812.1 hypothetical protein PIROE2DRAFT_61076 [Piromyces sp. E2]
MEGGIDSEFDVELPENYKPQLFHIKYVNNTFSCVSVPMSTNSLNNGDIFILDQDLKIYQWIGSHCNVIEKTKALEFVKILKRERNGLPEIIVLDNDDDEDATPFWDAPGGKAVIKDEYYKMSDDVSIKMHILNY